MLWRDNDTGPWRVSWAHHVSREMTEVYQSPNATMLFQRGFKTTKELSKAMEHAQDDIEMAINHPDLWRLAFYHQATKPALTQAIVIEVTEIPLYEEYL